ncbi:MAG: class B sortase [Firmicutes bacterium]|nr:class B sortase [Bacillota bacterium]
MKIIRGFFDVCDKLLGLIITFIAVVMLLFSGYVLYDNFCKGKMAFSSVDLQQYKPSLKETKLGFTDILALNPDTVAWLTINDTNIDYPVLHGDNDLEYINKDIYGKSSLTGSLYLRTQNSADFSDSYNLIYGHHMDNGAMFGDIEKYTDEAFFNAHRDGILMSPEHNYGIKIFAVMRTDAYDEFIYFKDIPSAQGHSEMLEYIAKNSMIFKNDTSLDKIIAFSTCTDSLTNGRSVVFASLTPITQATILQEEPPAPKRIAKGHYTTAKSWSLLDLLCVVFTFLTFMPFVFTARKYYQFVYAASMSRQLKDTSPKVARDLRHFEIKIAAGTAAEIVCAAFSAYIFAKTQYLHGSMTIMDENTKVLLAVFGAALLADIVFFRYRGEHPKDLEQTQPQ